MTDTQDPEQIQRDIEKTRAELGDTVEALAEKTDVKTRVKQKIDQTKASVTAKKEQLLGKAKEASPDGASGVVAQVSRMARDNPLPLAAAGVFAFGFIAGRISRR